jgi:hypothetical protein
MKKSILRTWRRKTQAEGNSFANNIYQRVFENDDFAGEQASIIELKVRNSTFEAADAKALLGGTDRTAARNKCYAALMDQLDVIADAIEYRAKGDTTIPEAAGFETPSVSSSQPVTFLEVPTILKVEDIQGRKGAVKITLKKDPNAVNYAFMTQAEGETEWQNGTYRTSVKSILTDLPSGKYVAIKAFNIGRNGLKSEPTEAVTVLVS